MGVRGKDATRLRVGRARHHADHRHSDTRPARLAQPRHDDMPMTRYLLTKDAAYNVRAVRASW